jgi:hypothetical protein
VAEACCFQRYTTRAYANAILKTCRVNLRIFVKIAGNNHMQYQRMRRELRQIFEDGGFRQAVEANEFLLRNVEIDRLDNGTVFYASYPGQKTDIRRDKYDYRVDIHKAGIEIPLSHVNIIVDIFNKCQIRPALIPEMKLFLRNIVREGDIDPFLDTVLLRGYKAADPPNNNFLDEITQLHRRIEKNYSRQGNQWDLTIEELYTAIS